MTKDEQIKQLQDENETLKTHLGAILAEFKGLKRICKFGEQDTTLTRKDVINILQMISKRVDTDIPNIIQDTIDHKENLEQTLYNLLVLTWEWSKKIDPNRTINFDKRQVDAINLLPQRLLLGEIPCQTT